MLLAKSFTPELKCTLCSIKSLLFGCSKNERREAGKAGAFLAPISADSRILRNFVQSHVATIKNLEYKVVRQQVNLGMCWQDQIITYNN